MSVKLFKYLFFWHFFKVLKITVLHYATNAEETASDYNAIKYINNVISNANTYNKHTTATTN